MDGNGFSCLSCAGEACEFQTGGNPPQCVEGLVSEAIHEEVRERYREPENHRVMQAAALTSERCANLTRVQETLEFAARMGARKIGIATCMGLIDEAQAFARILRAKGFDDVCAVACKVGAVAKERAGIADDVKVHPGCFEPTCNPVMQARILNEAGCDLNVIVGLCVGHDTLFMQHAEAPVTYLVVKDRVLAHNPAAALYTKGSYYRRLLSPDLPEPRPRAGEGGMPPTGV